MKGQRKIAGVKIEPDVCAESDVTGERNRTVRISEKLAQLHRDVADEQSIKNRMGGQCGIFYLAIWKEKW